MSAPHKQHSLAGALFRSRGSTRHFVVALLAAFFALFVIGSVVLSVWLHNYIRGAEFRHVVERAAGDALGGKAEIAPLKWTGSSAYADSFSLQGAENSVWGGIQADQIRANMNLRAVFSGAWRAEEINITQLRAEILQPQPHDVSLPTPARPSGIYALLPSRFELGTLNVASADLLYKSAQLSGVGLDVRPDGSGWVVQGTGGQVKAPPAPPMKVLSFRARFQNGDCFLTHGDLLLGSSGKVFVSGESTLGGKFLFTWEGIDFSELFQGIWSGRVAGILSGNATINGNGDLQGTLILKDGLLKDIPLLTTVGAFTQNPAFKRLPLQEARLAFSRTPSGWQISSFIAESKGIINISGAGKLSDTGILDFAGEVGLTSQTLQWIPGSRDKVFVNSHDGYLWTSIKCGGTLANPTEDLSQRLIVAMGDKAIDSGTQLIRDVPASAVEGARGILDMLLPRSPR